MPIRACGMKGYEMKKMVATQKQQFGASHVMPGDIVYIRRLKQAGYPQYLISRENTASLAFATVGQWYVDTLKEPVEMPELSNIKERMEEFFDYTDECGVGRCFSAPAC